MSSLVSPVPPLEAPHAGPALFVLIKGYNMGSLWLAQAFSAKKGHALAFEYEHCLKASSRKNRAQNGTIQLDHPNVTIDFMKKVCACGDVKAKTQSCRICPLEHATDVHTCRASGISIASMGQSFIQHVQQLRGVDPSISLVGLVRTNHVKHAISMLRRLCTKNSSMFNNHKISPTVSNGTMRVQPSALLARTLTVTRGHANFVEQVRLLRRDRPTHFVIYERMQQNIDREIGKLLQAVGVMHPFADLESRVSSLDRMVVKSSTEDLKQSLKNYREVEDYFGSFGESSTCFLPMLRAEGPVAFALDECAPKEAGRLEIRYAQFRGDFTCGGHCCNIRVHDM